MHSQYKSSYHRYRSMLPYTTINPCPSWDTLSPKQNTSNAQVKVKPTLDVKLSGDDFMQDGISYKPHAHAHFHAHPHRSRAAMNWTDQTAAMEAANDQQLPPSQLRATIVPPYKLRREIKTKMGRGYRAPPSTRGEYFASGKHSTIVNSPAVLT